MSAVTKPIILDETGKRIAQAIEALEAIGRPTQEQTEIAVSDWLDEHPEATTTVDFSIATKVFPTVADMIADETLKTGDNVATRGYYSSGDNGGANYIVSSTHTGVFYVTLGNGLYVNRFDESGLLKAESIGIKAHSGSVENPDSEEMSNNVALFNQAIYNGIYLFFGNGYYYFNSPVQLAHKNTYTIRGTSREATHLFFPDSDGFLFSDPIYYNYYVIRGMHIHAYGHTIRCAEHCLTVLDSHFEWLQLESETGDCFHAPNYNVAKYVNQGGNIIYDTCVQNCVFNFINASAPQGAAFCNIMGMYTYYQHMNFISCKYAFRNCDGTVEQANNLGTQQDYYIYYDKANSHSIRWTFINVNAEGLSKAFIYTEPRQAAGTGEDPKKPETANIVSISRLTAINSDWSLYGVSSGHTYYPMTVQEIQRIDLINSDKLITPAAYPSKYDTSVVKGQLRILTGAGMYRYNGGSTINAVVTGYAYVYTYYGTVNRTLLLNNMAPGENNTRYPEHEEAILADRFHGGRSRQVYVLTHSEENTIVTNDATVPYTHAYYDMIDVKLTGTGSATAITMANCNTRYQEIGKIITIRNNPSSTKNLILQHHYNNSDHTFYFSNEQNVTLTPGEAVHLIISTELISGTRYKVLKQLAIV